MIDRLQCLDGLVNEKKLCSFIVTVDSRRLAFYSTELKINIEFIVTEGACPIVTKAIICYPYLQLTSPCPLIV